MCPIPTVCGETAWHVFRQRRLLLALMLGALVMLPAAHAQDAGSDAGTGPAVTLGEVVVCAGLSDHKPQDPAAVFSVDLGAVYFYTEFTTVPAETVIYHTWYHRNEEVTAFRLTLQPPRWSSYSSITLREADKGPWRVEVVDKSGRQYAVMRFSIVD